MNAHIYGPLQVPLSLTRWGAITIIVTHTQVRCVSKTLQLCGSLTGKQRQATGNCTGRVSADGSEPESASIPWLGLQCVSRKGFTNFKTTTNSEYWFGRIYGCNILKNPVLIISFYRTLNTGLVL